MINPYGIFGSFQPIDTTTPATIADLDNYPDNQVLANVKNELDADILEVKEASLKYISDWDASTNTPDLTAYVGIKYDFFIVSTAGSTNLSGITDWKAGDYAVLKQTLPTNTWTKNDNTNHTLQQAFDVSSTPQITSGTTLDIQANLKTSGVGNYYQASPHTDAEVSALVTPQTGGLLYNSTQNELEFYDGSKWRAEPNHVRAIIGTGLINGGLLSTGTTPNTPEFSVSAGEGIITDITTDTLTHVSWSNFTDINPSSLSYTYVGILTYVLINNSGGLILQQTKPTALEQRNNIYLGTLVHVDSVNVDVVNNQNSVINQVSNQVRDLCDSIGFIKRSGNEITLSAVNLTFTKTAGELFAYGSNYYINEKQPHILSLSTRTYFQYRCQDGSSSPSLTLTDIDPDLFDDGTPYDPLTVITASKWASQRVWLFTSNNVKIMPPQFSYNSADEAKAGLNTEDFIPEPSLVANGILIGAVIVQGNMTNLANAEFVPADKFGSLGNAGSSGGGGGTQTLQQTYDLSTNPEILTDATNGALTLKRGSTADTDNVLEIQNGVGVNKVQITGQGDITANKIISQNFEDPVSGNGMTFQTKSPGYGLIQHVVNTSSLIVEQNNGSFSHGTYGGFYYDNTGVRMSGQGSGEYTLTNTNSTFSHGGVATVIDSTGVSHNSVLLPKTFQNVYNNSNPSLLVTDATNGAVTLKRGSAADTDNVLEIQNGAGLEVFRINGVGNIKMSNGATAIQGAQHLTVESTGSFVSINSPAVNLSLNDVANVLITFLLTSTDGSIRVGNDGVQLGAFNTPLGTANAFLNLRKNALTVSIEGVDTVISDTNITHNGVSVLNPATGNSTSKIYKYSISNSADTRPIYTDSNVTFGWDETANQLEFTMNTEPSGTGDMRSVSFCSDGTTASVFIVSPAIIYDLDTCSAGTNINVVIAAENDANYPIYKVMVQNQGESVNNVVVIEIIE